MIVKSGAIATFNVGSGSQVFGNQITGAGSLAKSAGSSGTLKLTGDNSYSGGTTVDAGTLIVANSTGFGTGTGAVTISTGATLQIGDGGTPNGSVGGDIQNAGDLIFKRPGSFTFSPKISGAGTVTFDTSFGSAVTLTGANDNTGQVKVLSGSLYDGASGAYSQNASFTLGSNASIFVAYDETISQLVDITPGTAGTVSIGSGVRLRIRPASTDTFTGTITGAGTLKLGGAGTQILAGANDYTGGTIVESGMLKVRNASGSATGSGAITVNAGAALQISDSSSGGYGAIAGDIINHGTLYIDRPDTFTFSNAISGTGDVRFGYGSTRIVTLTGTNSYSGSTTISEGHVAGGTAGAFSSSSSFTVNSGATLDVNSAQTIAGLGGAGAVALGTNGVLNVDTTGSSTFSGTISGGGTLTKSGAGTLVLSGTTSSYTGGTAINAGTLQVAADSSLGNSAGALSFNGGALKLTTTFASNRGIVLGAGGGTVATNAFEGTLNGTITGSGRLIHQGTGILTLSGTNTYTGGTTIQGGGVLDFTADANLGSSASGVTLNGGDLRTRADIADFTHPILLAGTGAINTYDRASTFSGQITGSGSLSVKSQLGGGVLTLTNSTNQWAGNTTIESGTLRVGATNALPTDNTVKVASGATLDVGADQTLRTVADYGTSSAGTVNLATSKTLTIAPVAPASFSGTFTGSGTLVKQGTAAYTLSGSSNAFVGRIDVVAGTLALGGAGSFSSALARIASGATLSVTGTSANLGSLDDYAAGSSGTLQIDSGLTLSNPSTGTFSGALNGSGSLTFNGAGALTFAGTSSFTGDVGIQSGTLTVGALDAFKAGMVTVAAGATFNVAKSTAINGINNAGTATVASGQTLTLNYPQTLSTVLSGAGSVAFSNFNMMVTSTITGDQTYTGDTVVNYGTLEIGAGGTSGTTGSVAGNILLNNGAVLAFNRAMANYSYAGAVSGSGAIVKQGSGSLTLTGASTYTGPTVVKGGTLKIGTTNALPTGTTLSLASTTLLDLLASQIVAGFADSTDALIAVSSGQVFNVTLGTATSGTTFDGVVQGLGAFAIGSNNGNGQFVTLTRDNVYTGGTTIAAGGGLRLGDGSATGMVAGDIVDNGVLIFERSNDVTFGGLISGSGKVQQGTAAGSGPVGMLTLTAANTYGGGTDVYTGRLRVMNTSGSATGSGTVTVHDRAAFAGNGSIAGALVVNRGGTLAAALSGTTPAELNVGSTTFNPGGQFVFVLRDANGAAGTDFSLLKISGTLTVLASSSDPFILSLYSAGGGAMAPAANFDPQQTYSWAMITTTGGVNGFDPAAFQIKTELFQNALVGGFSVSAAGGNVFLNYSPIPEPSTWALMMAGMAMLAWVGRRRGRQPLQP